MSNGYIDLPSKASARWKAPVANAAALPATGNTDGDVRVTLNDQSIYVWKDQTSSWLEAATPAATSAITALNTDVSATGPGAVVATIQPNVVSNAKLAQMPTNTIKGNNTGLSANAIDLTVAQVNTMTGNSGDVTLTAVGSSPNANGASLSGQALTLQPANTSFPGVLLAADWNTFNNKQAAGNYITALTGDGTASGPGSAALTLATVNSNVGSFGGATTSGTFTVNAKGLITAASSTSIQIAESQVTNLVSDLAGKQPVGNYITALTGDVTAAGPGSVASTIAVGAVTDTKASLANKPAVTVVATSNQTLSGTPTIDGQATAAGSVILLTAQTSGAENGPWVAAAGAWSRPTWYPSGGTTQSFQFITTLVRLGTTYQGTTWRMTTAGAITIDTTATTWVVTPLAIGASSVTGTLPIANGGTAATAIAPARVNLGVDKRTTFSNADYTVLSTDKYVAQVGTMSASRAATLPAANSVNAGYEIIIGDESGTVTATNTIVITRAGSDTIDGATTEIISVAYGQRRLFSDGSAKWSFDKGVLRSSNNLSDVASATTSRTNLGLSASPGAWKQIAVSNIAINNTGNTTENQILSFNIPAGTVGANATVACIAVTSQNNNANGKSLRVKFNGTTLMNQNVTTAISTKNWFSFANRNSVSSQISAPLASGSGAGFGNSTAGAVFTAAIDFGSAVTMTVTLQCPSSAADNIQLESFCVMVIDS